MLLLCTLCRLAVLWWNVSTGSLSWVWTSLALSAGQKTSIWLQTPAAAGTNLQPSHSLLRWSFFPAAVRLLAEFWLETNTLTHFKTSQTLSEPSHPSYLLCLLLCVIVRASVLYGFYIYCCVQLLFCSCIRTRIPEPLCFFVQMA